MKHAKCAHCDHYISYPAESCKLTLCGAKCKFKSRYTPEKRERKKLNDKKGEDR